MAQSCWKTLWQCVTRLNIHLPYDSAILLLDIYPRQMKTYVHITACKQVFKAALFLIIKNPVPFEWRLDKLRYSHTTKYSSAIKRREPRIHTEHEWISNVSCHVRKARLKMLYTVWFQFYDALKKDKTIGKENRSVVARG